MLGLEWLDRSVSTCRRYLTCLLLSSVSTDRGSLTRRRGLSLAHTLQKQRVITMLPKVTVLPASLVTVTAGRLKPTHGAFVMPRFLHIAVSSTPASRGLASRQLNITTPLFRASGVAGCKPEMALPPPKHGENPLHWKALCISNNNKTEKICERTKC